jgi:hypothetical protein
VFLSDVDAYQVSDGYEPRLKFMSCCVKFVTIQESVVTTTLRGAEPSVVGERKQARHRLVLKNGCDTPS